MSKPILLYVGVFESEVYHQNKQQPLDSRVPDFERHPCKPWYINYDEYSRTAMTEIFPTLWCPTKEIWFISQSVRTSESSSGYITNRKVGNLAILLEVSLWKRGRSRLSQPNLFGDLQGPNTSVALGCLARLNSCFFSSFFWRVYPHLPACQY